MTNIGDYLEELADELVAEQQKDEAWQEQMRRFERMGQPDGPPLDQGKR